MHTRPLFLFSFFALAFPFWTHAFLAQTDGTLIKGSGDEVYLLENSMKRWISSPEAFDALELSWGAIQTISDEDMLGYPRGKNIDEKSKHPDGLLVRESRASGGDGVKVYRIEKGAKRWIPTEDDFVRLGLEWRSIHDVSLQKLKALWKGKDLSVPQAIFHPLTVIQETPEKVVEDIIVKFRFIGVTEREDKRTLTFETFLEGIDAAWVPSGQEKTLTLPKKSAPYRFFVRAKDADGNTDKTPKMYAFEVRISPFFDQVTLSGSPRATDAKQEQVTLQGKSATPLDVTGWRLESEERHTDYVIPTEAYEIPNHPHLEYKRKVPLTTSTRLAVYTGHSPTGNNFRLNKCIGYLNEYYSFSPALPGSCPKPTATQTKDLSDYCQKVISGLNCKEPDRNDIKLDNECRTFLQNNVGYSACVTNNHTYFDFFLDEWRVYLNQDKEIWTGTGDAVVLRDADGLVVTRLKY